jgi:hypothetical protein
MLQVLKAEALEQELMAVSVVSPLLTSPWGLPFFPAVLERGFVLAARQLLSCVRAWAASKGTRPRHGNTAGGFGSGGSSSSPNPAAGGMEDICMQCAGVLTGWLRGFLARGAAAAATGSTNASSGAFAGVTEDGLDVLECMTTSLLLLLQGLSAPGLRRQASMTKSTLATAAAKSAAAGSPASQLELQVVLQDLMPPLCAVAGAATAAATAADVAQAGGGAGGARVVEVCASLLQLLIVLCRDHTPSDSWMGYLRTHVRLLPLAQGALDRLEQQLKQQAAAAAAGSPAEGPGGWVKRGGAGLKDQLSPLPALPGLAGLPEGGVGNGGVSRMVAGPAANGESGSREALPGGVAVDVSLFELMQVRLAL